MKDLYLELRKIIQENYNGELDSQTLDIITAASLAIYIKYPEMVSRKLPIILNKISILAGNDKVSTFVLKKFPNYPWNKDFDSESAMVIRALDSDKKPVDEEWVMAISTADCINNSVNVVARTAHELIHLLRFGGITESKREIMIRDGISFTRFDKKKKKMVKDNFSFEEGVVEKYTKDTMTHFYSFLQGEDLSFSPLLASFAEKFNGDLKSGYVLETSLVEALCLNPKFEELLFESFEVSDGYPSVVNYYNEVHRDHGAFSLLANGLDRVSASVDKGDINTAMRIISSLKPHVKKLVESDKKI